MCAINGFAFTYLRHPKIQFYVYNTLCDLFWKKKTKNHYNSCMVIVAEHSFSQHSITVESVAQGDGQYFKWIKGSRRFRCTNIWIVFGLQNLCMLCWAKQKPKCYTYDVVQQEHLCWETELVWLTPPGPGAREISVQFEKFWLLAFLCIRFSLLFLHIPLEYLHNISGFRF